MTGALTVLQASVKKYEQTECLCSGRQQQCQVLRRGSLSIFMWRQQNECDVIRSQFKDVENTLSTFVAQFQNSALYERQGYLANQRFISFSFNQFCIKGICSGGLE